MFRVTNHPSLLGAEEAPETWHLPWEEAPASGKLVDQPVNVITPLQTAETEAQRSTMLCPVYPAN